MISKDPIQYAINSYKRQCLRLRTYHSDFSCRPSVLRSSDHGIYLLLYVIRRRTRGILSWVWLHSSSDERFQAFLTKVAPMYSVVNLCKRGTVGYTNANRYHRSLDIWSMEMPKLVSASGDVDAFPPGFVDASRPLWVIFLPYMKWIWTYLRKFYLFLIDRESSWKIRLAQQLKLCMMANSWRFLYL